MHGLLGRNVLVLRARRYVSRDPPPPYSDHGTHASLAQTCASACSEKPPILALTNFISGGLYFFLRPGEVEKKNGEQDA